MAETNPLNMLEPIDNPTADPSSGKRLLISSVPSNSKYASSRGIITNGNTTNPPRIEEMINKAIDCAKYFSSLSLTCENAEFGEIITRKIKLKSKEDK
jgi:hypothetical protein